MITKKERVAFFMALGVLSGLFGFVYEVIFYFLNSGCKNWYMRGITFGPWIDIYVIGGLFIYFICRKIKHKPFLVFITSGVVCGSLEYLSGLFIYLLMDGRRAWNYNTEILNFGSLNGFICLRSVLFFALSGVFMIYVMIPFIKMLLTCKYKKCFTNLFILLGIIFIIDELYNVMAQLHLFGLHKASYYYDKLGIKYWSSK